MDKIIKPFESTKASEVNAQPSNRTEQKLTKIQGILTSNLRSRESSNTPWMAFLRLETADFTNHSLEQCQESKCKDCEIPVIFRFCELNKPKIAKGQTVILTGTWANSKDSNRPSFTCSAYEVLEGVGK